MVHPRLSRRLSCAWTLLFLGVLALANSEKTSWAQEPPTFELPEVTVPGRRSQPVTTTPASISVLTREDLERLGMLTIGEALAYVTDVHIRQQGGLGALSLPSIRGAAPSQVLVLIDGVPVNGPMTGVFDLSTISVAQVRRVEILKGPFSALYGGEGLGGVINIVTIEGGSEVAARAGSHGTTSAGGRWTSSNGAVSISADRLASSGFRPNSDVATMTISGRLLWQRTSSSQFTLLINHVRSELGVPGPTAFPSPQARQGEARTILSGRWERDDPGGQWIAHGFYWTGAFRFTDPAFAVDSRIDTRVGGAVAQRVWRRSAGHLQTAGFEARSLALQHNGAVGNRQAAIGALFVQDDRQISPRTLLSTGLRYDVHSIFGSHLNPRLGVVHLARDGLIIRAALGRTARGPTFSELYFAPFNNPGLRPESAWSADASVAWRIRPGLELKAGAFLTEATDLIRPDAAFVPQNIGRAGISGGSIDLAGQLTGRLSGSVTVSTVSAIDRATGAQLLRVPWVTAAAALHYRISEHITVTALAQLVGPRPDSDPATFTTVLMPAYAVAHFRITGTSGGARWQVGIDNVFEATYEPIAGFPVPGRSFFVAFSAGF
ncbi:MAG TPA: TonB-dependent receptor [bacterium]|nr:TonB-dependent receptor [bacterium]